MSASPTFPSIETKETRMENSTEKYVLLLTVTGGGALVRRNGLGPDIPDS